MDLSKIDIFNHEIRNFSNSISILKRELKDINNNNSFEGYKLCESIRNDRSFQIEDIKHIYNTMKSLEDSGIDGLYVEFEENMEEDYDGYTNYYTDVNIYGDKKYAQDKLDKRKIEIELEIENYNKRIEDYKEKLKLEVLRES